MRKFIIGNHLTVYLLAICALLASILAMQNHENIETQANSSPKAQTEFEPPERKNFSAPNFSTFAEITQRPLFSESRRPPPKIKPKPKAPVVLTPLNLLLEGIVISSAEKIGVFVNIRNSEVLHLTTGMIHEGWELTAISDTAATFMRGGQSQELSLEQ